MNGVHNCSKGVHCITQSPKGECSEGRQTRPALGKKGIYWGYIGIMEKKMETNKVYWGYVGIMETKMETIIIGYIGVI